MEILLTLLLAVLLIGGAALVFYVSMLAKNAYEIKIQLQADLAAGLKTLEEEALKNSRWLKRDLIEDLERSKAAIAEDSQRRIAELGDTVDRRFKEAGEAQAAGQGELGRAMETIKADVQLLGRTVVQMRRAPVAPVPDAPPAGVAPSPAPTA